MCRVAWTDEQGAGLPDFEFLPSVKVSPALLFILVVKEGPASYATHKGTTPERQTGVTEPGTCCKERRLDF